MMSLKAQTYGPILVADPAVESLLRSIEAQMVMAQLEEQRMLQQRAFEEREREYYRALYTPLYFSDPLLEEAP
jgi:hypothetical protein